MSRRPRKSSLRSLSSGVMSFDEVSIDEGVGDAASPAEQTRSDPPLIDSAMERTLPSPAVETAMDDGASVPAITCPSCGASLPDEKHLVTNAIIAERVARARHR